MKTYKNLFQEVCEFKCLYNAYLKARRGKNKCVEVLRFTYNLENELFNLQHELKNQIYKMGRYRHFVIFEPKKREISALCFRDKIVQHAVNSVIEPIFDKTFIYDSYACRKEKGTHAGINRLQKFLRKINDKSYVLKMDISKYFQNINHKILKKIIRKRIADEKLLQLLDDIINSTNKGIPLGNLTSQLFANIYLNELDKYVKYELKIKYYVRYMDDFIILHESKFYLHEIKRKIQEFLISIKLDLHFNKTNIFLIKDGIDFLGYRIFNTYKLMRKSTVKRFLKNIKKKINKYNFGMMDLDKLMESFNSWEAYMNHGNSYLLKKSLYERYWKNVM